MKIYHFVVVYSRKMGALKSNTKVWKRRKFDIQEEGGVSEHHARRFLLDMFLDKGYRVKDIILDKVEA